MTILPTQREDGEGYPSVADLLRMDDLAACDIAVPNWTLGGRRVVVRVQALSLRDQEAVLRASRLAAAKLAKETNDPSPPEQDIETYLIETWARGVVAPRFDREQAQGLRSRNGRAIEAVATFIWAISALDQSTIERYVTELTPADAVAERDPAPDAAPGA
jgi:hypothetical protein